MKDKKCFKCGLTKPISEFYKHPRMGDGYLGKCKECTKQDARQVRENRLEYYKKYDRERYYKDGYRYKDDNVPEQSNEQKRIYLKRYRKAYPEKDKAHSILSNAVRCGKIVKPQICSVCGRELKIEGHHGDYSKPLEVIWVCKKCHCKIHMIINAQERLINSILSKEQQ